MTPEEIETEAEALMARMAPRRRVRPRLAEPLRETEPVEVETPVGTVMAWRLGRGPAVLLVHGWEDDNCLWAPLIDTLWNERGRSVAVLDLPGHGFSPAGEAGIVGCGQAVRAVAGALGPIDAVVTHSFGGPVSISAMSEGLAADRAVLIAPPIPSLEGFTRRMQDHEVPEAVIARVLELQAKMMGLVAQSWSLEDSVPRMTARALLVHALDDEQCPAENSRTIADLWPGGMAKVLYTDNLGHRLVAQDAAILSQVADFLDD